MGKVYKVEKVRSTFHTFHDYLNFCGEKKDDRLFTIYEAVDDISLALEIWSITEFKLR